MKNKHNVEIYDNGHGYRIALELFNGMRWSMTVEKAIELKESLEYGIISASPNNAMHSDGEGCIHCDSGEEIPSAFNYCPYCGKKLRCR